MKNSSIRDSKSKRWLTLIIVSFTMLMGYFVADVMSPLKSMIETQLSWNSEEYGLFSSAYGWLNFFFGMLILGGIALDKFGIRLTGTASAILMVIGAIIKYTAISHLHHGDSLLFGIDSQVLIAGIGYAIFCVGVETFGITASKVVVKWFQGKELALALALQIAVARIGTMLALSASVPVAKAFGTVTAPLSVAVITLLAGLVMFLYYCVLDKQFDKAEALANNDEEEESFKLSDLVTLANNKMFWLICFLCLTFYSAVFPFLKYATDLMVQKFGVSEDFAGMIPSLLPFSTLFFTPIFGTFIDRKGKAATIMIIGSVLLLGIHLLFSIPVLDSSIIAIILMIGMGLSFSLVPSAMWPSLAKITPQRQLGSAYAIIFWIQNGGLTLVPYYIGYLLRNYCESEVNGQVVYDYTYPMQAFSLIAAFAVVIAFALKWEDKRKHYGLEEPNYKPD